MNADLIARLRNPEGVVSRVLVRLDMVAAADALERIAVLEEQNKRARAFLATTAELLAEHDCPRTAAQLRAFLAETWE